MGNLWSKIKIEKNRRGGEGGEGGEAVRVGRQKKKQEKNDVFLPTACLHLKKWATPVHLWYTRTNFELPLGQVTHYLLKFRSSITPGLVGAQDGPLDVPDPGVVGGV